jgi:hypothetical protein
MLELRGDLLDLRMPGDPLYPGLKKRIILGIPEGLR